MKVSIAIFALTATAALASSANASTISPLQAAGSQGQNVIVEGVARVHDDASRPGTDIDLTGHDNSHILGFIPQGSQTMIPDLKNYDGKTIDLTGIVQTADGQPEIIVTSPRQLNLASSG